ncbi:kinesin-like protein KIF25 isoform X4 [Podarcis muralis]
MRPGDGISLSFASQQRIRQLEQKLRTKQERIIVLETENALLHLKLAKNQGIIGKISGEEANDSFAYYKQQRCHGSVRSVIIQLHEAIQKLKQEVKNLRLSALTFSRDVQHHGKTYLGQILAAVQRLQMHNEAMQTFQTRAFELEQSLHEVNERYQKEKQRRKVLHNSLIELRGNIRVHCRIRPLLPFDTLPGESDLKDRQRNIPENVVCEADDETVFVKCNRPGHALINKTFQYERVYSASDSQVTVFADVAPLLTSLLDGYNVCIMAYGQTGSGKTHTMLGPQSESNFTFSMEDEQDLGIIPRASEEVFRPVEDAVEFLELVNKGLQLRVKHPTLVHAHSSRSHLVITLTVTTKADSEDNLATPWAGDRSSPKMGRKHFLTSPCSVKDDKPSFPSRASSPTLFFNESTEKLKRMRTKLQLVDLAGSECAGMSGVTGSVLRETSFINRSLSALADVLGAISEQRSHVPYRNSKLTHLLQDSIGGDAKLLVVLCVSPSQKYITESLQTLGFGSRARQVQRGHTKKRNQPALSKSK